VAFTWLNGFHDAANAVAAALATRALTPRVALWLAATLNGLGALLGVGLAAVAGVVIAGLAAAISWNLLTWWWGLPSSSSHALLGGLAGAGLVIGGQIDWGMMTLRVLLPLLLSPVLGLIAGWLATLALQRMFSEARHRIATRGFRIAQAVTTAAVSLGHGVQDGQKAMGVIVLALLTTGGPATGSLTWPLRILVAVALAAGTAAGGWRLIRTLGYRLTKLDPVEGVASGSVATVMLYVASWILSAPVSSTHIVASAIAGAGLTKGPAAIRWDQLRRVAVVWLLTPLVTATVAGLVLLPLT
jgi:PiT family inorganic phosphate transporter